MSGAAMAGHTPGPWKIRRGVGQSVIIESETRIVAECVTLSASHDDALANGRLIAAAPETAAELARGREVGRELLAALRGAVGAMKEHNSRQKNLGDCFIQETADGLAAIAKAEAEGAK